MHMETKVIPINRQVPRFYNLVEDTDKVLLFFNATVRAGFPSPAADYAADPIDLNKYLTENPTSTFVVRVEGDSMIGAHIEHNDLAIVNRLAKPDNGRIVVAFVQGEFTMKRLSIEKNGTYLRAENPAYSAIRIDEEGENKIWGVVVGIIKKFK
jgi:DNA polymerase V